MTSQTASPSLTTETSVKGSAFFAGFSGLAYQIIAYKLILAAGLGDGLSIALSLTAFVTLAGVGAVASGWLGSVKAGLIEPVLGIYGLILFGGIFLAGLVSYIEFLDQFSLFSKLAVVLAIQAPLALFSGALLAIYDRRNNPLSEGNGFSSIYAVFHLGGAAALLLLENYLFPEYGYLWAGLILSGLSLANGGLAVGEVVLQPEGYRGSNRRTSTLLFIISIATGVLGIATYKAFDHIVGPNIRNYTVITASIFLGLGLSGWFAARKSISVREMTALSGAGCLLFCALILLTPSAILNAVFLGLPATAGYAVVAAILCVPIYALIGLSVPVCVQDGLTPSRALFVCAIGNCIGYWLYIGMAPAGYDFVGICVAGIALLAYSRFLRPLVASVLLIGGLWLAGYQILPSVHQTILAERFITQAEIEDEIRGIQKTREFSVENSWATWGSPVEHISILETSEKSSQLYEYLVINGFLSLRLDDVQKLQYGEAASTLIPTLYVEGTDKALVIGAGTGISAGSLTALFNSVDLVDLNPDTKDMLKYFSSINRSAGTGTKLIQQDAFSVLSKDDTYDYIFGTATGAGYSFSALLYSQEFFERAKRSLSDDGVFAFWLDGRSPTSSTASQIVNALSGVFGHVERRTVYPHQISSPDSIPYTVFMASDKPLELQGHAYGVIEYLNRFSPPRIAETGRNVDMFLDTRISDVQFNTDVPAATIDTVAYAYGYRYELQIFEEMISIWQEMANMDAPEP